jgi:MipA family protein
MLIIKKSCIMQNLKLLVLTFAALFSTSIAAHAQLSLGLGVAVVPQFEGSKDYDVRAAPVLSFKNDKISVRTNGPGLEMDLLSSRAVDAGPIVRYKFGRDGSKIDNAQVSALPNIKGGVELGGYAQVNIPLGGFSTFIAPRVSVVQGVQGGAVGTVVEAGLGLLRLQGDWTLGARAAATYASADYMNTRFGVGTASPSGLASFNAGEGIKDVGLSLFANYKINDSLSITGVAGYKTLQGDAANSPIVRVSGTREQGFISLGVTYSFN